MSELLLVVGLVALVLLGLLVLGARLADRSWTDDEYERERQSGTALGNAFLQAQSLLDPGAQHALEQRTAQPVVTDDRGDPPTPTG